MIFPVVCLLSIIVYGVWTHRGENICQKTCPRSMAVCGPSLILVAGHIEAGISVKEPWLVIHELVI